MSVEHMLIRIVGKTTDVIDKVKQVQLVSDKSETFTFQRVYEMMTLGYIFISQPGRRKATRIESYNYFYIDKSGITHYCYTLRSQRDQTPKNNLSELPEVG